ncbi:MAG TPA: calcium-binding protein, partial [Acetobacteraceae bacterium]
TGGSPPVLSGGGNTVSWTLFGPNTVVDSGLAAADTESSTLSSATVSVTAGLLAGDRLNFTNQNGITGSYNAGTGVLTLTGTASLANYQAALESITYSSTSLTPTNLGGDPTRTVTWQVNDGTANSNTITSTVDVNGVTGQTFFLTTNADTVVGTANNDLVIAATNALSTGDVINGNGGTDTIALSGGGTFDLALPKTINGVQVIRAFEGQGATAQTLTLRAKTALTVDVASDVNGDASPTITIIGAANTDTINLGSGNDTVTLGGTGETVNGGGGDNIFDVTGKTIGAAIHGGSGTNALIVNGGGSAVMGGDIDGIATVGLTGKTKFTANALSGLTITGDVAGNTVLLGASNQVFIGTGGADKLTGVAGGLDVLRGTSAGLNFDSFSNFLPNDTIDITDLAPASAAFTSIKITGPRLVNGVMVAGRATLALSDGTHSLSLTLPGALTGPGTFFPGSFALATDGHGGTDLRFVPSASPSTFVLPTTPITISAPPVDSVFSAGTGALNAADSLSGVKGFTNTVALTGSGTYDLSALATVTNLTNLTAQEGEGPTAQTVILRAAEALTVNVAADPNNGDLSPTITIVGANDHDVINLGPGNDVVTLGSKNETVNSGGGDNTFNVTAATIGAVINGGGGSNTLVVSGGGKVTMGASVSGIADVQLSDPTTLIANTISGMRIHGSIAGGDIITLGAADQSVVSGGANETVIVTAAQAGVLVSGLGANSTLEITGGGAATLNAATQVSSVVLKAATTLQLNGMQFIHAVGSTGADSITAGAVNQTLTGGSGADTLTGFTGGLDIFSDTALGLKGDTISNFVSSDQIHITNLASVGAVLTATANGANTSVSVTSGTTKTNFTMTGPFSQGGFTLASDGGVGTLITHS